MYARERGGIIAMVSLVTPSQAQAWLARNSRNRPVSAPTAARYVRAILRREWLVNGEPVILDRDDNLLDGQHRLEAILRVGIPLPITVVWGVDPAAFVTLNTGKTRSLADVLEINGEAKCRTLASCARLLHNYYTGTLQQHGGGVKPSHAQLLSIIAEHPGVKDALAKIQPLCKHGKHPPSVFAFLYYLCDRVHPDRAGDFFERLLSGAGLRLDTPEYALSRILSDERRAMYWQTSVGRVEMIALCIKAWNLFIVGEPCKLLRWQSGPGKFPAVQ